ncbi:hypothetical protein ACFPT7_01630 [Acidicapsa dinghuensis]|uniref:Uncharacterized protein n=1 Tax=Acidicapsa dinghuensis TaxID=2218256 RepID=A0ABW1EB17_9BACT|nr:hypothetical protein [Acidicapsa dinghuensis]
MRKSREVPLTLLAVAALASVGAVGTTGCHEQPGHCVDQQNRLMPDQYCRDHASAGYHYIYGGSSGGHIGDMVVGGSVSRGGFGGFGGGDGGGE